MKRLHSLALWLTLGAVGLLWWVGTASAQGGYDLSWWTVEAGGTSSGDGYEVTGVAGQMDAGVLSDGTYTLTGGFMTAGETNASELFLPSIEGE